MTAGLTVYNDYGTIQIDENWRNYGFRQKISVPFSTSTYFNYDLLLSGEAVLVAVRASTLNVIPMGSLQTGTSWSFTYRIGPPFTGGTYSETVDFYVFDVLPAGVLSNVGLEVYNQAGARVFHSDMDIVKIPSGGILSCASNFSGVPGRTYAAMVLLNPIRSELVPGFGYGATTRRLWSIGSDIITDDVFIGYGTTFLDFINYGMYAAVDVTGL